MIGDWPSRHRGALCSRAFYPGPASPRAERPPTVPCAKKKIAVSGRTTTTGRRTRAAGGGGEEGRKSAKKNPDAAGPRGWGRGWKKRVKNKLPGGIDKKIPARFFFAKSDSGHEARAGGSGVADTYMYIYIHVYTWKTQRGKRRSLQRTRGKGGGGRLMEGWVSRITAGGRETRRGYQLIRNTPSPPPPPPPLALFFSTRARRRHCRWLKCNLSSSLFNPLFPPFRRVTHSAGCQKVSGVESSSLIS